MPGDDDAGTDEEDMFCSDDDEAEDAVVVEDLMEKHDKESAGEIKDSCAIAGKAETQASTAFCQHNKQCHVKTEKAS